MLSSLIWQDYPPEKLLTERFHISTGFHPGQRDIIMQLVQGKRVLVIQRTGWGKSLCYQVASLYYPHLTIIFSPLKALMRDQCQRCNDTYAIPSAIISSEYSEEENRATLEQAVTGIFKILFIAPERLDNARWQSYAAAMRISMIVIDEAHCVSTWGHDFRPHYRRILNFVNALPTSTPVLALTATANKRVEQDILQQLGKDGQVIRGTMQRPNLCVHVETLRGDREKLSYLAEILPHFPGTGIIYTTTQHTAERLATFLLLQGIKAEYYHAGREDSERKNIEHNLMTNQYKVVCSTNALGMGIDKPDIRFVIHYQLPASPIHYYQEMGRAGRDGKVAWCILLYDPTDLTIQEHFLRTAKPAEADYEMVLSLLRTNPAGLRDDTIMRQTGLSEKATRNILADLGEQNFIEQHPKKRMYTAIMRPGEIDFAAYDSIRAHKQQELDNMQNYVHFDGCYMQYLTSYLGDETAGCCRVCGHCRPSNFPTVRPSVRMKEIVGRFLQEDFAPRIEKRGTEQQPEHEAGWSLCYHNKSSVGHLVRLSKYENFGPFTLSLVHRVVDLVRTRYPIHTIDGIIGIPPTRSGLLVETFARQVAAQLGIEYVNALVKVRPTQEQKDCTNRLQKADNVRGAFRVSSPALVRERTLLVIDDIYDSGYMMREVGKTLMQAGARQVYPLTITRTAHSDDQ